VSQLSTTGEAPSRPWIARNLAGPDLAEAFLVAAVVVVITLRTFLAATGYPQVGGSRLHIAHLLYGGLGMLLAILMLLMLVGSRVHSVAAWIGGLGFGFFVDELGKFLTTDNNYFFRPAIALIYAIFVLLFLFARSLSQRREPSRQERLAYAYAVLTDVAIGSGDSRRRSEALAQLAYDEDDDQVTAVRALLTSAEAPVRTPGRWARVGLVGHATTQRLYAIAADVRIRRGVVAVFFVLAVSLIVALLLVYERRGDWTPPLDVVSVGSALSILGVGLLSVLGVVQLLNGARVAALTSFYRATQVSIFFAQFFAFIVLQLGALAGLALNLLILVALRVEIAVEKRTA